MSTRSLALSTRTMAMLSARRPSGAPDPFITPDPFAASSTFSRESEPISRKLLGLSSCGLGQLEVETLDAVQAPQPPGDRGTGDQRDDADDRAADQNRATDPTSLLRPVRPNRRRPSRIRPHFAPRGRRTTRTSSDTAFRGPPRRRPTEARAAWIRSIRGRRNVTHSDATLSVRPSPTRTWSARNRGRRPPEHPPSAVVDGGPQHRRGAVPTLRGVRLPEPILRGGR